MTTAAKPIKKRDITRQKMIHATIDCIYEEGFYASHTNRIAERAGVSWGVIQYHFGDKNGLLIATLENIFKVFNEELISLQLNQNQLQDRVSSFIDCLWDLMNRPSYVASIDILKNSKETIPSEQYETILADWAVETDQCWERLFTGLDKPSNHGVVKKLVFAGLRGFADTVNPHTENPDSCITALKAAAIFLLENSDR